MRKYHDAKKKTLAFRFVRRCVNLFYGDASVVGEENLPDEPCIIVSNHAKMNGPICSQLFTTRPARTWCIGQVMKLQQAPAYAYEDFWSHKPRWSRCFWKMTSYIIAPLCVFVFNGADTIPVYRDGRLATTFKQSLETLNEGVDVVIFPEKNEKYNHIINEFQDKYVDLARLYYNKYKKPIKFVPMYNAPTLRKLVYGEPIEYDPNIPIQEQRKVVCDHVKSEISRLATTLPKHKVIPYDNIPKRDYRYNIED